jgi:uncharacterized membrane protein HdeD (DUF308 family)
LTRLTVADLLSSGDPARALSLGSERFPGWGWVLGNGGVTLILGVMIWRQWPQSAVRVSGLFVGIDLFSAGVSWVALALALRKNPKPVA